MFRWFQTSKKGIQSLSYVNALLFWVHPPWIPYDTLVYNSRPSFILKPSRTIQPFPQWKSE